MTPPGKLSKQGEEHLEFSKMKKRRGGRGKEKEKRKRIKRDLVTLVALWSRP
jgi:hypothetical protein